MKKFDFTCGATERCIPFELIEISACTKVSVRSTAVPVDCFADRFFFNPANPDCDLRWLMLLDVYVDSPQRKRVAVSRYSPYDLDNIERGISGRMLSDVRGNSLDRQPLEKGSRIVFEVKNLSSITHAFLPMLATLEQP